MRTFFLAALVPLLIGAAEVPNRLIQKAQARTWPSAAEVFDAGFDPARKAEFDALAKWATTRTPDEAGQSSCLRAERRGPVRAMVRALQLSHGRAEAEELWREALEAEAEGRRLAALPPAAKDLARPTELGRELARRVVPDQAWRAALYAKPHSKAAEEVIGWLTRPVLCRVDEGNTEFMKTLVAKSGWPLKSVHGADAAGDAWLLVQHADDDRDFQRQVLALIGPLVAKGEVAGRDFALLFDRVALADKLPQRYGSQFHEGPGGCMRPSTLEDPAGVDARRKAVGLPPLGDYAQQISRAFKKPLCATAPGG
jgi:hypothetical protein